MMPTPVDGAARMTAGRMSETRTSLIGAFLVALGPISMALYTPRHARTGAVPFSTT